MILNEISQIKKKKKPRNILIHFYEIFRIDKFIETQGVAVIHRSWGQGRRENNYSVGVGFPFKVISYSRITSSDCITL